MQELVIRRRVPPIVGTIPERWRTAYRWHGRQCFGVMLNSLDFSKQSCVACRNAWPRRSKYPPWAECQMVVAEVCYSILQCEFGGMTVVFAPAPFACVACRWSKPLIKPAHCVIRALGPYYTHPNSHVLTPGFGRARVNPSARLRKPTLLIRT